MSKQDFNFFLSGDLSQMATQKQFLSNMRIVTKQNNVYPCLREVDIEKSMTLIWKNKVEGWWHYKDQYVKYGICTEDEFMKRL